MSEQTYDNEGQATNSYSTTTAPTNGNDFSLGGGAGDGGRSMGIMLFLSDYVKELYLA